MDCRNCFLLVFAVSLLSGGCLTQRQETLPQKKQTSQFKFPVSLGQKPETKRLPRVDTCLKGGYFLEKQAFSDELGPRDKQSMLERARKAYMQALSIEPNNPKALAGVARIYTHFKDYNRAMEIYRKAVKLHPNDSDLWLDLGMCHLRQKQYPQGIDALRRAVQAAPENRDRATTLGYALARAGKTTEAIEVLSKVHGPSQAHFKVGWMLLHMNQPGDAKQHFEESVRLDSRNLQAQQVLARLNSNSDRSNHPDRSSNFANIRFDAD